MQSFILVGDNISDQQIKIDKLLDSSWLKLNFEATNIEQVREIIKFASLSVNQNTAILINGLDTASVEAQNSFLKSFEEPQDKLIFIILTKSEENIIDTIRSRAQVIFLKPQKSQIEQKYVDFDKLTVGQKLQITSKIKKREEAIEFIKSLIYIQHSKLIKGESSGEFLINALAALKSLNQNGNVNLQLTNFVVQIS